MVTLSATLNIRHLLDLDSAFVPTYTSNLEFHLFLVMGLASLNEIFVTLPLASSQGPFSEMLLYKTCILLFGECSKNYIKGSTFFAML